MKKEINFPEEKKVNKVLDKTIEILKTILKIVSIVGLFKRKK